MDPARAQAWERFFDKVVARGGDWPPHLWFAAVEDGLAAALSRQSPLVEAFCRDTTELLALKHAGRDSWLDAQRIGQLEAQIQATLCQADEIVRGPAPASRRASGPEGLREEPLAFELARSEPFWPRALRACSFGLLLVGSGLLAGVYLYDARLAHQVGQEVGRHVAGLQESITRAESNLAAGMAAFQQESERVSRLQSELAAESSELRAMIRESLQAMAKLGDTALADLEERLTQETNAVADLVGRLEVRGAALDRALHETGSDLAAVQQRLPETRQSLAALEQGLDEGRTSLARTVEGLGTLQSAVPDLSEQVDAERAGLETAIGDKRQVLASLEEQLTGLRGELEASGERLGAFSRTVEQQLQQAQSDGLVLKRRVDDLHASSEAVATLILSAEAELEAARAQTQKRIDAMLTEMAEKADLAVMRGDEFLDRAQAQATRRVEAAGLEATRTLDRLRAEEIAGLAEQIAATRTELEQTRAGLAASWQRMDRFVAERHDQLLSELDRYAETMEGRVQQLLEALDVRVAPTEPKKSERAAAGP